MAGRCGMPFFRIPVYRTFRSSSSRPTRSPSAKRPCSACRSSANPSTPVNYSPRFAACVDRLIPFTRAPMRASLARTIGIVLRSIGVTLAITIPTVLEVYRGSYRREDGDRRLRWWSQTLLSYVDLRFRVVNPHDVEIPHGRPCILMSNHSSLDDIPLLFMALPGSIRMLTKKELRSEDR